MGVDQQAVEVAADHAAVPDPRVAFDAPWRDTSHGRLYRPLGHWAQIGVFLGCFVGSIAAGWVVVQVVGGLSGIGEAVVHLSFLAVFFLGYALWSARLVAIASAGIGRALWRLALKLVLLRRLDRAAAEALLDPERWVALAVKGQRAGASFGWVGIPIAFLAAGCGLLVGSDLGRPALAGLLLVTVGGWSLLLARLGRRGCLPFPEPE